MALKSGNIIRVGEILSTYDYIQSPNGVFFAVMQDDGNFCVYIGAGPDDNNKRYMWCSQKTATGGQFFAIMQHDGDFCVYKGTDMDHVPAGGVVWGSGFTGDGGEFFAVMQDDGNFCVYKGTGPDDNQGVKWDSGPNYPVDKIDEISSIVYDIANAKILDSTPADLYMQKVINETDDPQTSSISGTQSVSETSGWSDALGVTIGAKTSFKCGVPALAEGKVEVDVQASNTYTWNGSQTVIKTWEWNTPITVPPHRQGVVLVSATMSTIEVPYTLPRTVTFKSGESVVIQVKGLYTGTNSHDLTVMYQELAPGTLGIEPTEWRALPFKATATYAIAS